jgi:biuret amidohydrolase
VTTASALARTAVLALHYQNDVLHPQGRIRVGLQEDDPARARVIEAAARLLGHTRERDLPLIHVRIAFRSDYADLIDNCPLFRKTAELGAVQEESWGAAFFNGLEAQSNRRREYVVTHQRTSAFIGTPLELILRKHDVTNLIVAGVATHSVVEMTARHASDLGYTVTVLADACACADNRLHQASLDNMRMIAAVSTVQDAFMPEIPT